MICSPTAEDKLVGPDGRPYFLWDVPGMTLDAYRAALADPDPELRAYWLGKLMREGKPDDLFLFARIGAVIELWPLLQKHLGRSRAFWTWILDQWKQRGLLPE